MTRKQIALYILTLISIFTLPAQEKLYNITDKPNFVFFAPLNMFESFNPAVQLGYERVLNDRISAQVEGGIILNKSIPDGIFFSDDYNSNSGFKIRGEVKYFLNIKKSSSRYLSCELFYTKNKSHADDYFIASDTTYNYPVPLSDDRIGKSYEDRFINDKQKIGLNIKTGYKFTFGSLFIEPQLGIGIAYRMSKHSERIKPDDKIYTSDAYYSISPNQAGNIVLLNIPINIKIGVRF